MIKQVNFARLINKTQTKIMFLILVVVVVVVVVEYTAIMKHVNFTNKT